MIPIDVLQVIDSIDRKGSFAAAAEELYRVPSAITYTIKKVEDQLNIKLFDRRKQRAQLTPAGKVLLERGRDILRQLRQLEEQAKRVESGWENHLRIVVDTILPTLPLWPLIAELQALQSGMHVQVLEESLNGSWETLINQRADLLIGVTGDEPAGGHWNKQALGNVRMRIYCGSGHPAAQLPTPITYQQLEHFVHVVVSDSARYLPPRNVGMLGLKQVLTVPTMALKYEALINNMGISHLPHYFATEGLNSGKLKQLVLETNPFPQTLFMVWPKADSGQGNQWLRSKLIETDCYSPYLSQ